MLQVYSTKDDISGFLMPVRRARVLLRCLEFLYRDEEDPTAMAGHLGFPSVSDIGEHLVSLTVKQVSYWFAFGVANVMLKTVVP